MQKNIEANKARNLALLFLGIAIILGVLFLKEYLRVKDASVLGRTPLLLASLVACGYYASRYFKLKS